MFILLGTLCVRYVYAVRYQVVGAAERTEALVIFYCCLCISCQAVNVVDRSLLGRGFKSILMFHLVSLPSEIAWTIQPTRIERSGCYTNTVTISLLFMAYK